jgi:hypothetical protein
MGADIDLHAGTVSASHGRDKVGDNARDLVEAASLGYSPDSSSGTAITHQAPPRTQSAV